MTANEGKIGRGDLLAVYCLGLCLGVCCHVVVTSSSCDYWNK